MRRLLLVLALLTLPCPAGAATATLTWDAYTPSDGFAIRIETAPAPEGPFLPLASVPATVATYIDTTVRTGALACYRLQAIRQRDGVGSLYSAVACGLPGPSGLRLALLIQQPAEGAVLPKGKVVVSGTTAPQMASLSVRINGQPLGVAWSKTTGAWSGSVTLTRLGAHVVGVAVWHPLGDVEAATRRFEVR